MKQALVKLTSNSPITFGRMHETPKIDRELPDEYERRTWREKMHVDEKGEVYITPFAVKNCLSEAAKFLGKQIPGKGKSTYTKHFEAGIIVMNGISLGVHKDDVSPLWLAVPSDGVRGGSKRVKKAFPQIMAWEGEALIYVLDEIISRDVLNEHLDIAGKFIGMGSLRVRNNGINGRFSAEIISFE